MGRRSSTRARSACRGRGREQGAHVEGEGVREKKSGRTKMGKKEARSRSALIGIWGECMTMSFNRI